MVLLRPKRSHFGTTGIPLSGPVEGSELDFLYASHETHLVHLVTAVTYAALDPVRRASYSLKNLLVDVRELVLDSVAPRRLRQNTRATASWSSTIQVHTPGPLSLSRRLQSRDRKPQVHDSTAPVISLLEAALHFANTSKPLSIREIVDFLPCLELRKWTAEARDARVEALFVVLTSCRAPDGRRITRPFVVWCPACVVQDRTLRKVVVVGAANRCFGHMRTLKSEKPRRPIAQALPSWE